MAPWDVIIKGTEKLAAFNELQASVKGELTLFKASDGKITYRQVDGSKLSKDAKRLMKAVDDKSVTVNVNAENTTATKSGNLYIGGAFSGNTVTQNTSGNTVLLNKKSTQPY